MSNTSRNSKPQEPDPKAKQPARPSNRQASTASEGQVFLSYSRNDRDYVTNLAGWLEGHGTNVWFDHDIDYGAKWEVEIQNQLDASSVVLVIMSKSARRSKWVPREVERAKQRKVLIMPLHLEQEGIVDCVADLQFENVIGDQMPGLRLCQKFPGFLVSEMDLADALTAEQQG